jgi:hypothetical protein
MIPGPAGMRCPDCAALRATALYKIPPARLALAVAAGAIVGVLGGVVMSLLGFFVFFVGPIYGGIVAEAVLRSAGRKSGMILKIIAMGGIGLGAVVVLLPMILRLSAVASHIAATTMGMALLSLAWPLLGFVLAFAACYARLRFW